MSPFQFLAQRSIINSPSNCMLIPPMTYSPKGRERDIDEGCPCVLPVAYAPTLLHRSGGWIGQYAMGTPACDQGVLRYGLSAGEISGCSCHIQFYAVSPLA